MKEFLSQKGIHYDERDVSKDAQALEDLEQLGYMTTPVTKVDDVVIVGFDRKRLEEVLE